MYAHCRCTCKIQTADTAVAISHHHAEKCSLSVEKKERFKTYITKKSANNQQYIHTVSTITDKYKGSDFLFLNTPPLARGIDLHSWIQFPPKEGKVLGCDRQSGLGHLIRLSGLGIRQELLL